MFSRQKHVIIQQGGQIVSRVNQLYEISEVVGSNEHLWIIQDGVVTSIDVKNLRIDR